MAYLAKVILDIEFPLAESLEQANTTLSIWLDLIGPILDERVRWESVDGTPAYEIKDN